MFKVGDVIICEAVGVPKDEMRVVDLLGRQVLCIGLEDTSGRCSMVTAEDCRKVREGEPSICRSRARAAQMDIFKVPENCVLANEKM